MTYQSQISSNHLQTIYRVMLKRIGKGYTAERLSFLIGKEHNYIEKVETLLLPVYSIEELERIALALEETNHRSFYAPIYDDTVLNILIETEQYQKTMSHSYSVIDENGNNSQLFMLTEEQFGDFDEVKNSNENLAIAVDSIGLLIRGGYFFASKMAAEILHSVNSFHTIPLDPFYIELAIMQYCKENEKDGLLRKCESVIDGIRYEER